MNLTKPFFYFLLGLLTLGSTACRQEIKSNEESKPIIQVTHPDWSKNVSIYEINVRQFTPEGTFAALEAHLPRIKELGTEIIWLMPIHPIGIKNRKGTLGSYYSIKDYKGINPEFGDTLSFKRFVKKAHDAGLRVIIDWVPNHSSWDNELVTTHPEWYAKDSTGKMFSPFDWTDVVKFDYNVPEMRAYMLDAMEYWIREYDIDGYRCDVAGEVPMDFWDNTRKELDKIKPVFMLAEAEGAQFHSAFDMTYGWEFHHIMNKIYKGEAGTSVLEKYLLKNDSVYPEGAYRMYFITNHDENSWNGTEFERLGDAVETFYALTVMVPGMPLVYTGQEAALNKRFQFFEKDPIDWGDYKMTNFYKTLLNLKSSNSALFNGKEGGSWKRIKTDNDEKAFVILRKNGNNEVLGIFNLGKEEITINLMEDGFDTKLTNLFTGEEMEIVKEKSMTLPAWSYQILHK